MALEEDLDWDLLDLATEAAADGPIGLEGAKKIWESACAGTEGISDEKWKTIQRISREHNLDAMGQTFLKEALRTGKSLRQSGVSPIQKGRQSTGSRRSQLSRGQQVKLFGLVECEDLNGKTGTLSFFDEETGRWVVQLDGVDSPMRIHPLNLTPAQAGRGKSVGQKDRRNSGGSDQSEPVEVAVERIQELIVNAKSVLQVERLQQKLLKLLQGNLKLGDFVEIVECIEQPEMNGVFGKLYYFDKFATKWAVELKSSGEHVLVPASQVVKVTKKQYDDVTSAKEKKRDEEDTDSDDEEVTTSKRPSAASLSSKKPSSPSAKSLTKLPTKETTSRLSKASSLSEDWEPEDKTASKKPVAATFARKLRERASKSPIALASPRKLRERSGNSPIVSKSPIVIASARKLRERSSKSPIALASPRKLRERSGKSPIVSKNPIVIASSRKLRERPSKSAIAFGSPRKLRERSKRSPIVLRERTSKSPIAVDPPRKLRERSSKSPMKKPAAKVPEHAEESEGYEEGDFVPARTSSKLAAVRPPIRLLTRSRRVGKKPAARVVIEEVVIEDTDNEDVEAEENGNLGEDEQMEEEEEEEEEDADSDEEVPAPLKKPSGASPSTKQPTTASPSAKSPEKLAQMIMKKPAARRSKASEEPEESEDDGSDIKLVQPEKQRLLKRPASRRELPVRRSLPRTSRQIARDVPTGKVGRRVINLTKGSKRKKNNQAFDVPTKLSAASPSKLQKQMPATPAKKVARRSKVIDGDREKPSEASPSKPRKIMPTRATKVIDEDWEPRKKGRRSSKRQKQA